MLTKFQWLILCLSQYFCPIDKSDEKSRGLERMSGDIIGSQISNQLKNMQQAKLSPHASKYGKDFFTCIFKTENSTLSSNHKSV